MSWPVLVKEVRLYLLFAAALSDMRSGCEPSTSDRGLSLDGSDTPLSLGFEANLNPVACISDTKHGCSQMLSTFVEGPVLRTIDWGLMLRTLTTARFTHMPISQNGASLPQLGLCSKTTSSFGSRSQSRGSRFGAPRMVSTRASLGIDHPEQRDLLSKSLPLQSAVL